MKTTTINMAIIVAMPIGYDINIRLCGDQSSLTILETYEDDTPEELIDRTIKVFQNWNIKGCKVEKLSKTHIKLEFTGQDTTIIQALLQEFNALSNAYWKPTPYLSPSASIHQTAQF
jgi:hypothetical protein